MASSSILQSVSSLSTPALIGLVGAYFVGVFLFRRYNYRRGTDVQNLPGPGNAHWLWGHDKMVFDRSVDDQYSDWFNQYGETISVKGAFGFGDMVVTSDAGVLNHIFTKHQPNFQKALPLRKLYDRVLGKSIVSAEGADHKRMKAAMGPAFTADRVRGMENLVLECTETLVATAREHVLEEQKKSGGKESAVLVNALDWTGKATLDVIGRVGWGWNFQCGKSPISQEIHHLWREWVDQGLSTAGFIAPLVFRSLPWLNDLPLKAVQAQGTIKQSVARLVRPIAVERVAQIEAAGGVAKAEEEETNPDVLTFLIRASVTAGQKVDVDELVEHMVQLVLVGHETSATVIAYAMHALARNPDIQDKLRAELDEFNKDPSYEDLHNPKVLTYLDAVCKEALRVFPVVAHTERVAMADDVIPMKKPVIGKDGKKMTEFRIKEGQTVIIPLVSINTHTALWGPDGHEFRPSRWLNNSEALPRAMPGGWQYLSVFGEGPRLCTGMRLATFEIKAILAGLVRNFRLVDTGLDVHSKFLATMQPFVIGASKDLEGVFMPVKLQLLEQE